MPTRQPTGAKSPPLPLTLTSSRRGRWYVTVFLDAETHRLLYVAEGRSSHAVQEFAQALVAHGGDCQRIQWVAMDMLHCYAKGVFLTKTAKSQFVSKNS